MTVITEKSGAEKLLHQLVEAVVGVDPSSLLVVVEVQSWFDSKWLFFGGKALGALAVWKTKTVVVPPFHPNRVRQERHFAWSAPSASYMPDSNATPLHGSRSSESNLRQYLSKKYTDAHVFWQAAAPAGRCALMHYRISNGVVAGWYLGFEHSMNRWRVERAQGIAPAEIERFLHPEHARCAVTWEEKLDVSCP